MIMSKVFIKGSGGNISAETTDYLLKERVVTLEGDITDEKGDEIVRQLLILASQSPAEITMLINSPGGSVSAGLSVIDTMRLIGRDITCVCTGLAASMAAVIFSEGTKRLMFPHSRVMIHQAKVIGNISGNSETLSQIGKHLSDTSKTVDGILAKNTGKTLKEIAKATSFDNYMTPEEAISFGIADATADSLDSFMEVRI